MSAPERRHTRFQAIRLRLEAFDPGKGWRLALYEFLLFGFKQGWACLFGGLLLWALVEIVVINRTAPWAAPAHPIPIRKEWTSALATLVVFVVVGLIHGWLGPNPFGM